MTADGKPIVVYCTFPDRERALSICAAAVDAGLAACANVLGAMTSIYIWEGRRHQDEEVAAILKTDAGRAAEVVDFVKSRHPYDNPAVMVLPVTGGSAEFLAWISGQVRPR